MKTTKSISIAVDRAADLVGATVAPSGQGRRCVRFVTPKGRPHMDEGNLARVLYVLVHYAITRPELGGLGLDREAVADAVRLRLEGIPSNGLGGHETLMLEAIAIDRDAREGRR